MRVSAVLLITLSFVWLCTATGTLIAAKNVNLLFVPSGKEGAKIAAGTSDKFDPSLGVLESVVSTRAEGIFVKAAGGAFEKMSRKALVGKLIDILPGIPGEVIGNIAVYLADPEARGMTLKEFIEENAGNMARSIVLAAIGSLFPEIGGTILFPVAGEFLYQGMKKNSDYWKLHLGDNPSKELRNAMDTYWMATGSNYHGTRPSHWPKVDEDFMAWLQRMGKDDLHKEARANMAEWVYEASKKKEAIIARQRKYDERKSDESMCRHMLKELKSDKLITDWVADCTKGPLYNLIETNRQVFLDWTNLPKKKRALTLSCAFEAYRDSRRLKGHSEEALNGYVSSYISNAYRDYKAWVDENHRRVKEKQEEQLWFNQL